MDDRTHLATGGNIRAGDIAGSVAAIGHGAQAIVEHLTQYIQQPFSPARETEKAQAIERRQLAEALISYASRLRSQAEKGSQANQAGNPYMQLASYDIEHAALFFGRDEAIRQLLDRLGHHKLTVLHADSGAGKTSLLKAGVMSRLFAGGQLPVYVRAGQTPVHLSLKRALVPQVDLTPTLSGASLHDFLRIAADSLSGQALVVIVDQFEEAFTEQTDKERNAFLEQLAPCLQDPALPVRWVLALRGEWLTQLSKLRSYLGDPFANEMLLESLSRKEARQAIVEPALLGGVTYDAAVVDRILDDLDRGGIAPPHLQLVCWTLFDSLPPGKRSLSGDMYKEGDARRILQDYLSRAIRRIDKPDRAAANLILAALITSDGRRHRRTRRQLTDELALRDIASGALDRLTPQLIQRRLISPAEGPAESDEPAYELTHDYLTGRIQLDSAVQARKAVQEMLERAVVDFKSQGVLLDQDKYDLIAARRQELAIHDDARRLIGESERALRRQRLLVRGGIGLVAALTIVALVLGVVIVGARQDLADLVATSDAVQTRLDAAEQAAVAQRATATALAGELQSQSATATAAAYALKAQIVFKFDNYQADDGIPSDQVFSESAQLQIAVAPSAAVGGPLAGWKNVLMLSEPAINLTSNVQSIDRQNSFAVDGASVEEIHTFTDFDGYLGEYSNSERWKDVTVEALFSANSTDDWLRQRRLQNTDAYYLGFFDVAECAENPDDLLLLTSPMACFDAFYGVDKAARDLWDTSDYSVQPVMPVSLEISVAGGKVATLQGILARVYEWDEDVRGLYVARFQAQK